MDIKSLLINPDPEKQQKKSKRIQGFAALIAFILLCTSLFFPMFSFRINTDEKTYNYVNNYLDIIETYELSNRFSDKDYNDFDSNDINDLKEIVERYDRWHMLLDKSTELDVYADIIYSDKTASEKNKDAERIQNKLYKKYSKKISKEQLNEYNELLEQRDNLYLLGSFSSSESNKKKIDEINKKLEKYSECQKFEQSMEKTRGLEIKFSPLSYLTFIINNVKLLETVSEGDVVLMNSCDPADSQMYSALISRLKGENDYQTTFFEDSEKEYEYSDETLRAVLKTLMLGKDYKNAAIKTEADFYNLCNYYSSCTIYGTLRQSWFLVYLVAFIVFAIIFIVQIIKLLVNIPKHDKFFELAIKSFYKANFFIALLLVGAVFRSAKLTAFGWFAMIILALGYIAIAFGSRLGYQSVRGDKVTNVTQGCAVIESIIGIVMLSIFVKTQFIAETISIGKVEENGFVVVPALFAAALMFIVLISFKNQLMCSTILHVNEKIPFKRAIQIKSVGPRITITIIACVGTLLTVIMTFADVLTYDEVKKFIPILICCVLYPVLGIVRSIVLNSVKETNVSAYQKINSEATQGNNAD